MSLSTYQILEMGAGDMRRGVTAVHERRMIEIMIRINSNCRSF